MSVLGKKALIIFTVLFMGLASFNVFAQEKDNDQNKAVIPTTYSWKIDSKKFNKYVYGGWRDGISGTGPMTLTYSTATTKTVKVKNTISGSYPVGIATISASMSTSFGVELSHKASISIKVPKGKKMKIILRPVYKQTKITQRQWGRQGSQQFKTNNTKVAYVNIFSHWDYSSKEI